MTTDLPGWLSELYPFKPRTLLTGSGAVMSYVDEGKAGSDEAIVFVHGNPTWSFYFRRLIQALSGEVRCIAPDHIGMGLSEKPQDYDYRLNTRIADLENLISKLGLRKVNLVMHDWGGAIGSGWAVKHSEMVGKLAYLNTSAFASQRIPARINVCRSVFPGTLLVRGLNGFAGPATWMSMHRRSLSRAEKRAYLYPYGNWNDRVAVNAFVKDIPMSAEDPSWETLKSVEGDLGKLSEKEICLVWGGKDFCFNKSFFDEFQRRFPRARTRYLDWAGHYVLEDAVEETREELKSFLLG